MRTIRAWRNPLAAETGLSAESRALTALAGPLAITWKPGHLAPAAERRYLAEASALQRWIQRREELLTPLATNLRAFFTEYTRTFHADIERFCDLYEFPSETVRLDGTVQRFQDRDAALAFFALAKKKYEDEGCAQWGIRDLDAEALGPGSATVTIDWEMKSADGIPIRGWRQTYDVIGGPTHWRVQHSTLHSGSEVVYPALPRRK